MNFIIFLLTLILLIWRPAKVGIGWISCGGALLSIMIGIVRLDQIFLNWVLFIYPILPILLFLGLDQIFQKTGITDRFSQGLIDRISSQGHRFFLMVLIIIAITTPVLTNYGSLLLWSPIILVTLTRLQFKSRTIFAFLAGIAFLSDWSSLGLITSNMINTIVASYMGISLPEFASIMFWVNGISIITGIGVLCFYFWSVIPSSFSQEDSGKIVLTHQNEELIFSPEMRDFTPEIHQKKSPIKENSLTTLFYFDPVSGGVYTESVNQINTRQLRSANPRQIPWLETALNWFNTFWVQVLFFSIGINILSLGLIQEGLIQFFMEIWGQLGELGLSLSVILMGLLMTIQACFINSSFSLVTSMLALQSASIPHPQIFEGMVYTAIISSVIGAKIFPLGSLSSLLWLGFLKHHGFTLSWRDYTRLAFTLTLPVLLLTWLGLIFILSFR